MSSEPGIMSIVGDLTVQGTRIRLQPNALHKHKSRKAYQQWLSRRRKRWVVPTPMTNPCVEWPKSVCSSCGSPEGDHFVVHGYSGPEYRCPDGTLLY